MTGVWIVKSVGWCDRRVLKPKQRVNIFHLCVSFSYYSHALALLLYNSSRFVSETSNLKTYQFITMCKGDINRHQPKTAKINLGLNHHVFNSRTALTRRAILNTCKMWCFLLTHVCNSLTEQ